MRSAMDTSTGIIFRRVNGQEFYVHFGSEYFILFPGRVAFIRVATGVSRTVPNGHFPSRHILDGFFPD